MAPILAKLKSLFDSNKKSKATSSPTSGSANAATSSGPTTTSGVDTAKGSDNVSSEAQPQPPLPTTVVTPPTPAALAKPSDGPQLGSPTEEASNTTNTSTGVVAAGAVPTSSPSTNTTTTQDGLRTTEQGPAFDIKNVTVVFVLGGPGAGKGTQCAKLVQDYGFTHLSAGDLLRAEQTRPGSSTGAMIKEYITEGKIVPMEVTIKLLENAMTEAISKDQGKRFLIDGFPRKMDQAVKFDESVCQSALILFLVCPENILLERLLERGKTSGRDDDNTESIKKRFQTFIDTSMPVVDYYRKMGKVVDINSAKSVDEVYGEIVKAVEPILKQAETSSPSIEPAPSELV